MAEVTVLRPRRGWAYVLVAILAAAASGVATLLLA
jgi:hypothetical protein